MRRRCDDQRNVVPQRDDANDAVLEPLGRIAHGGLLGRELLETFRLHEVPEVPVLIQVLHLGVDHVRRLQRLPGAEGALDGAPGLQIADLDAVERLPLARLDELVFHDGVGVAIQQNLHAAADFARRVTGHFVLAKERTQNAARFVNG